MIELRTLILWAAAAGGLAATAGCEAPSLPAESDRSGAIASALPGDQAPTAAAADATAGSSRTAQGDESVVAALSAWKSGKENDAVQMLMAGRLAGAPPSPDVTVTSVWNLTEDEFVHSSEDDRTRLHADAMELVSAARGISRQMLDAGAAAANDSDAAKKHYEGALRLGQALAQANRLAILRMVGDAIVKGAREKLSVTP